MGAGSRIEGIEKRNTGFTSWREVTGILWRICPWTEAACQCETEEDCIAMVDYWKTARIRTFKPLPEEKRLKEILKMVKDGIGSVRWASEELGWYVEDVQMAVWGEVRQ